MAKSGRDSQVPSTFLPGLACVENPPCSDWLSICHHRVPNGESTLVFCVDTYAATAGWPSVASLPTSSKSALLPVMEPLCAMDPARARLYINPVLSARSSDLPH